MSTASPEQADFPAWLRESRMAARVPHPAGPDPAPDGPPVRDQLPYVVQLVERCRGAGCALPGGCRVPGAAGVAGTGGAGVSLILLLLYAALVGFTGGCLLALLCWWM